MRRRRHAFPPAVARVGSGGRVLMYVVVAPLLEAAIDDLPGGTREVFVPRRPQLPSIRYFAR